MAKRNKEYEHGYCLGYEHYQCSGGTLPDAKREIIQRFGKKYLYSSFGYGFLAGFQDHKEGNSKKYD